MSFTFLRRRFTIGFTAGHKAIYGTIIKLGKPDIATHWVQISRSGILRGMRRI